MEVYDFEGCTGKIVYFSLINSFPILQIHNKEIATVKIHIVTTIKGRQRIWSSDLYKDIL